MARGASICVDRDTLVPAKPHTSSHSRPGQLGIDQDATQTTMRPQGLLHGLRGQVAVPSPLTARMGVSLSASTNMMARPQWKTQSRLKCPPGTGGSAPFARSRRPRCSRPESHRRRHEPRQPLLRPFPARTHGETLRQQVLAHGGYPRRSHGNIDDDTTDNGNACDPHLTQVVSPAPVRGGHPDDRAHQSDRPPRLPQTKARPAKKAPAHSRYIQRRGATGCSAKARNGAAALPISPRVE